MRSRVWITRALLIFLQLVLLIGAVGVLQKRTIRSPDLSATDWSQIKNAQLQPGKNQEDQSQGRFRIDSPTVAGSSYSPKYETAWVHPTNYGRRYGKDINGVSLYNRPIVVLHETVSSGTSAVNFFQTPHSDETDQASYHTLIKLDGTIVYLVPPELRAFGAGNSVFNGPNGAETVKTDPKFPPSVNNFAYHAALETPSDGWNNARIHSGYTEAQYHSLAWLITQSSIPDARITTHRAVDRSGSRIDPRSFDFKRFLNLLDSYRASARGS